MAEEKAEAICLAERALVLLKALCELRKLVRAKEDAFGVLERQVRLLEDVVRQYFLVEADRRDQKWWGAGGSVEECLDNMNSHLESTLIFALTFSNRHRALILGGSRSLDERFRDISKEFGKCVGTLNALRLESLHEELEMTLQTKGESNHRSEEMPEQSNSDSKERCESHTDGEPNQHRKEMSMQGNSESKKQCEKQTNSEPDQHRKEITMYGNGELKEQCESQTDGEPNQHRKEMNIHGTGELKEHPEELEAAMQTDADSMEQQNTDGRAVEMRQTMRSEDENVEKTTQANPEAKEHGEELESPVQSLGESQERREEPKATLKGQTKALKLQSSDDQAASTSEKLSLTHENGEKTSQKDDGSEEKRPELEKALLNDGVSMEDQADDNADPREVQLSSEHEIAQKTLLQAQRGDAAAQMKMAQYYEVGYGVERDAIQTAAWYRLAGEQGDRAAQGRLGWCYEKGLGLERDLTEALKWYRRSALKGETFARLRLGVCYQEGIGVDADKKLARTWYQTAAEQGDAEAQRRLGWCFEQTDQFKAEGAAWYEKAALQGDALAQLHLGKCYEKGIGVAANEVKKAKWYRLAAEQGNAEAQGRWGYCCQTGRGTEQDKKKALEWYSRSVEQGNTSSMNLWAKLQRELATFDP